MRVIRIFVPEGLAQGAFCPLDSRTSTHLIKVLRLPRDASLRAFDGRGHEFVATLVDVHSQTAILRVDTAVDPLPESPLRITLAQGISRGERMDYAIQKATELGVAQIIPLLCERSVVRLDAEQAIRKQEHWAGVAQSAAEQCGRAWVPEIHPVLRYAEHVGKPREDLCRLVLDPEADTGLRALRDANEHMELLIGPEGGLSSEELKVASLGGFRHVRLGPRVLRTETAAAAAITALQVLHGDLG
jgi:16S rRNA (uracil1498-N3)-methyltransferase